jgi:hypothetical protein
MLTNRQPAHDHQQSTLKEIFTSFALLKATAAAIEWQPAPALKSLDLLLLNQTPIYDDLINHHKRKSACSALQRILGLTEEITRNVSQTGRSLLSGSTTEETRSDTLTQTSEINDSYFSPLSQVKQIRHALIRQLKERDLQDQIFLTNNVDQRKFPAHIQQLSRQIVHTQVTLKLLLQQQIHILTQHLEASDQPPMALNHVFVANANNQPVVICVCLRQTEPLAPQVGYLRTIALKREKIKIIFKKHELRLQHLTGPESQNAKLIWLLAQAELFRLLLKESIHHIDGVLFEAESLSARLNTLMTQANHNQPRFKEAIAALSQESERWHKNADAVKRAACKLNHSQIMPFIDGSTQEPIVTEL